MEITILLLCRDKRETSKTDIFGNLFGNEIGGFQLTASLLSGTLLDSRYSSGDDNSPIIDYNGVIVFFVSGLAFPRQSGKTMIQETGYEISVSLYGLATRLIPCRGSDTF
ncbi:MAG: hypothetical protein LBI18_00035 [Planctomycetaceae bacterium]|jgi:hypothetical protein|nr:hypothetical protein [Planctomycetaceae bacterium]